MAKKSLLTTLAAVQVVALTVAGATPSQAAKGTQNATKFATKIAAKTGRKVQVSAEERQGGKVWYKGKVLVNAPAEVVWQTVHDERQHNPDLEYSKILSQTNNSCVLEQKFCLLPVIGSATCVTDHTEVPLKRIDYKLVKSDRFKEMEGSWVLTPTEDGRCTTLELSSHMDMGFPVPKPFMNAIATKKMERRLVHIRQMAESTPHLAAQKPSTLQ